MVRRKKNETVKVISFWFHSQTQTHRERERISTKIKGNSKKDRTTTTHTNIMTRKNGHTTLKKRRTNELSATRIAAYGLIMFSSAALNNIFVSYYIELFCFVLDMDSAWFFISQFVFMIWNASNDPIFGYLSDAMLTTEGNKRIDSIRWGGFLWCVAFVTVWFPPSQESWGPAIVGLYFMFCLCFYDGLLTFVEVNHQALLAEIGTNIKDRARCNHCLCGIRNDRFDDVLFWILLLES